MTIQQSTFSGNTATGGGGASDRHELFARLIRHGRGGERWRHLFLYPWINCLDFHSTISGNTAAGGNGNGIGSNGSYSYGGAAYGGGVYANSGGSSSPVLLTNCTVAFNQANAGARAAKANSMARVRAAASFSGGVLCLGHSRKQHHRPEHQLRPAG